MTGRGATVSVVIPTRNRLGMLAQTVHSVLAQDVELDVVVVDEASSDGTPRWLANHPDPRVRFVRHETARGLSQARNAGIAASTGRWLAFVDDDDLWMPGKLAAQLAAAERHGALWAFGGALTFTEGPRLLYVTLPLAEDSKLVPWKNTVPGGGSNAIVAREALDEVGGFDPSVNIAADWDLWIRLLQLGEPAVVPHPVMAYRLHPSNMSKNTQEMLGAIRHLDERYRDLRSGQPLDWQTVYRWLWSRTFSAGDRATARRIGIKALRAGHPGATKRVVRTLIPLPLGAPVNEPDRSKVGRGRIRPRRVIPWPTDAEAWIHATLEVTP